MGDANGQNGIDFGGERRSVQLTPASEIQPRPVRWCWTDRIPVGELTMTPGRGGIGKSTFHAWLIARLTRGQLSGVHRDTPRPCMIAASEDSWSRTIVPRLIAAGADLDLVFRVDVVTELGELSTLSLPADLSLLEAKIAELGVALVSVDPLLSVIGAGLDSHKDRDVRVALEPLARMADRTRCVVLGNAHFVKGNGTDALAMIMGSAAFGNVPRAALGFARDPDAEGCVYVISQVKNNLGRLDLPNLAYQIEACAIDTPEGPAEIGRLVMCGESDRSVSEILATARQGDEDRSELSDAAEWLVMYFTDVVADGYAPAAEVLAAGEAAGFPQRTLRRARKRVGIRTGKAGFGGGWVWSLPTEGATQEVEGDHTRALSPSTPSTLSLPDNSDTERT